MVRGGKTIRWASQGVTIRDVEGEYCGVTHMGTHMLRKVAFWPDGAT